MMIEMIATAPMIIIAKSKIRVINEPTPSSADASSNIVVVFSTTCPSFPSMMSPSFCVISTGAR